MSDQKPLTDEELDAMLADAIKGDSELATRGIDVSRFADVRRLVAEVRRLRSDRYTFMPMLTAKELETIDALIQVAIPMTDGKSDKAPPKAFARLISDYRRLLSDQWLQAAAIEAIAGGELARLQRDAMIAILRKHRDGR